MSAEAEYLIRAGHLGEYDRALRCSQRARELAPKCPLVLWDLAGTLQVLGRHEEALALYRALAKRKRGWLAKDPCVANRAQAKGLIADAAFIAHLDLRGPGCFSLYPLKEHHKPQDVLRNWRPSP